MESKFDIVYVKFMYNKTRLISYKQKQTSYLESCSVHTKD